MKPVRFLFLSSSEIPNFCVAVDSVKRISVYKKNRKVDGTKHVVQTWICLSITKVGYSEDSSRLARGERESAFCFPKNGV